MRVIRWPRPHRRCAVIGLEDRRGEHGQLERRARNCRANALETIGAVDHEDGDPSRGPQPHRSELGPFVLVLAGHDLLRAARASMPIVKPSKPSAIQLGRSIDLACIVTAETDQDDEAVRLAPLTAASRGLARLDRPWPTRPSQPEPSTTCRSRLACLPGHPSTSKPAAGVPTPSPDVPTLAACPSSSTPCSSRAPALPPLPRSAPLVRTLIARSCFPAAPIVDPQLAPSPPASSPKSPRPSLTTDYLPAARGSHQPCPYLSSLDRGASAVLLKGGHGARRPHPRPAPRARRPPPLTGSTHPRQPGPGLRGTPVAASPPH